MKRLLLAAILSVLATGLIAANVGAKDTSSPSAARSEHEREKQAVADIKAGRGRVVNSGVNHYMSFWRECEWVVVKTHETPYAVASPGAPGGQVTVYMMDTPKPDFDAQLPPSPNPHCNGINRSPNQDESDAMRRNIDTLNNAAQGDQNWTPPVNVNLPVSRPS